MSKMFPFITETWNVVIGCKHDCSYCWAQKLAEGRLKSLGGRYVDGFKPKLIEKELHRKFKPDAFVFVSDMGDMFGDWVPKEWIIKVINHIKKFPDTTFLFLTKNPNRYFEFLEIIPQNVILGATIETNRDYKHISKALSVAKRFEAMSRIETHRCFISIEPIMYFDFNKFADMIYDIHPVMVAIGYDNYSNNLKEPSLAKTMKLIREIQDMEDGDIFVYRKTLREKRC